MRLRTIIGTLISAAFLYIALSKIDFGELYIALKRCDYLYIIPAVLTVLLVQTIRSLRWYHLLKPVKKTGFKNVFSATMIGLMANNIFPARAGEFVRAKVIGDDEGISMSSAFATLVIERIFDGLTILLILLVTFLTVDVSKRLSPQVADNLKNIAYGVLALYIAIIVFIVLFIYRYSAAKKVAEFLLKPFPQSVSDYCHKVLESFKGGLRLEKSPKDIMLITFYSVLLWSLGALAIQIILLGFGYALPLEASFVTLVILFFATIIPAGPGYIGTFHAGIMYALTFYGLSKEAGFSVGTVLHMINFFTIVIAGAIILWHKNISLKAVGESGE